MSPIPGTEVGGYPWGGGGPLTVQTNKPRRKPTKLPYWHGLSLQIVGPGLPQFAIVASSAKPVMPVAMNTETLAEPFTVPELVHTPLPGWAVPRPKIRPALLHIALASPELPQMLVRVQASDDDDETLLMTFLMWLAR